MVSILQICDFSKILKQVHLFLAHLNHPHLNHPNHPGIE
uniref:Uncharacterized protein n=1 Tax=Lepeophtheirus salmonis TaxID=72036 RepID=A0A0K2UQC1_LEPSM